eukprot:TRINITY_DN2992_c0_g1_i1.p1 TRINITY_DN2992_c0_g1~~TRINITY_DN2992_c0_g1_i1.p1  ORF type:complete len:197 (+),score=53.31 TRINITY_DN2992_c0_g1_i1:56-592(+)
MTNTLVDAVKEFRALQEKRSAAYSRLDAAYLPQFTASLVTAAMQIKAREEAAFVQKDFVDVSTSIRALEDKLNSGDETTKSLGKLLREIQTYEKNKLHLTHAIYKSRMTLKGYSAYAERRKDPWEADEEFYGNDFEGKPPPVDVEEDKIRAARKEMAEVIDNINDCIDRINAMIDDSV